MRIVVYPHDLGIGGSQLNAIELAAAVRALGHEVLVFGRPGALVARIEACGLEFVEAPAPGKRPSPSVARALAHLVRDRGIDLVHGYEWPPILEGVLSMTMGREAAVVGTVMSMSVPTFIPRSIELVVGTEEIGAAERTAGRRRVHVLEPPVDLGHNEIASDPGVEAFRARFGLDGSRLVVVSVARFAHELKLEGTLTAIRSVGEVGRDSSEGELSPVSLVLVGDGPARAEIEAAASEANARHGDGTVVITGQLDDPRPAYAAADVALGMGGSALRALAYGKPLIVQGERGFWRTLTPESLAGFLWTGWYGIGDGAEGGGGAFRDALRPLLADPARRRELGEFGLRTVRERFSLERAAGLQLEVYLQALEGRGSGSAVLSESVALARYARYYGEKRALRALGRERLDDFNSRPVTARNRDRGA
ncbi:glycosyltransferase family 4 protein [Agromyces sp. Leaf222]|uniref:glycosyltransferase family 4 protein n=1 Tax=Agromyces sp. Leaf222 TaxID=1735688 RepID=UPI0007015DAB|nr:glycosyltransferase family 4 protein [Agromyces sp. Leaf222]KQM81438.1 group 1 glycosyl transferase [Agromyces sp. Leaf222]